MRHKRRLHAGRGYGCCNRVKGGSATVSVFQISHTEICAACQCSARHTESRDETDDRWSPVRFALVSHQLTDLQACSLPHTPPPSRYCSSLLRSRLQCFLLLVRMFAVLATQRRNFHLSRNLGLAHSKLRAGDSFIVLPFANLS